MTHPQNPKFPEQGFSKFSMFETVMLPTKSNGLLVKMKMKTIQSHQPKGHSTPRY